MSQKGEEFDFLADKNTTILIAHQGNAKEFFENNKIVISAETDLLLVKVSDIPETFHPRLVGSFATSIEHQNLVFESYLVLQDSNGQDTEFMVSFIKNGENEYKPEDMFKTLGSVEAINTIDFVHPNLMNDTNIKVEISQASPDDVTIIKEKIKHEEYPSFIDTLNAGGALKLSDIPDSIDVSVVGIYDVTKDVEPKLQQSKVFLMLKIRDIKESIQVQLMNLENTQQDEKLTTTKDIIQDLENYQLKLNDHTKSTKSEGGSLDVLSDKKGKYVIIKGRKHYL